MKYIELVEKVVHQLPSKKVLQNYGRSSKLLITTKDILDLQFKLAEVEDNGEIHEESENSLEGFEELLEVMESGAITEITVTHSLRSVAGTALKALKLASENCEHSEILPGSVVGEAMYLTMSTDELKVSLNSKDSENHDSLINLRVILRDPRKPESQQKSNGDHGEQGLSRMSECSEQLPKLWGETILEETDIPPSRTQTSNHNSPDVQASDGGDSSEFS